MFESLSAILAKFQRTHKSLGDLVKMKILMQMVGEVLSVCNPNLLPGYAKHAEPRITTMKAKN